MDWIADTCPLVFVSKMGQYRSAITETLKTNFWRLEKDIWLDT